MEYKIHLGLTLKSVKVSNHKMDESTCEQGLIPFQNRDVAQSGSVLAWGARGRWFKSSHPDFFI